jgi:hypothetical protein
MKKPACLLLLLDPKGQIHFLQNSFYIFKGKLFIVIGQYGLHINRIYLDIKHPFYFPQGRTCLLQLGRSTQALMAYLNRPDPGRCLLKRRR